MKVSELIAELQKQNQDVEVFVEGCDCIRLATGIQTQEDFMSSGLYAASYKNDQSVVITSTD